MQNPALTIIILTCDAYKEIWDPAFFYFRKSWPDCPYPVYFVSDKKTTYQQKGVTVFTFVGKEFGGRVFEALQKVQTPYVLFLQEEYWLRKPINNLKINSLLENMETANIQYLRLQEYQRLNKRARLGKRVRKYTLERVYDADNHCFIAQTSALLAAASGHEEAHFFERHLTKRLIAQQANAAVASTRYFPFQEALVRGIFFRQASQMAKKSHCYQGTRREMTRFQEMKYYYHRLSRDYCPR